MSGPKVSTYTLTAAQLLAIQMELERQRKEKEEIKQLQNLIVSQKDALKKMQAKLGTYEPLSTDLIEWNNDSALAQAVSSSKIIIEKAITDSDLSLSKFRTNKAVLNQCAEKTKQTLNDLSIKKAEIETLARQKKKLLDSTISKAMSVDITDKAIVSSSQVDASAEISVLKEQWMGSIEEVVDNDSLRSNLSNNLRECLIKITTFTDVQFLKNYCAIEVEPLLKQAKKEISFAQQHGEEYKRLQIKYSVLNEEAGNQTAKIFTYDEDGLLSLRAEIRLLEQQCLNNAGKNYIYTTINEVMQKMGYSILGERDVKKKSGVRFHSELYDYGNGNGVNVTYASDGKITMELGKVDTTDRMPDAGEAKELKIDMEHFCFDFKRIEDELNQRGILVGKRISLMPPDESFAQIINTNDFELCETKEKQGEDKKENMAHPKRKMMSME